MEPSGQKAFARVALLLLTVLGVVWIVRLDFRAKISTNILDLIPVDQRSPELALVRSLAAEQQARVALFVLAPPEKTPVDARASASAAFVDSLKSSGVFADVANLNDTGGRDRLGKFVFERRFELLLPSWLADRHYAFAKSGRPQEEWPVWLAEEVASGLDRFLAQPESIAFQELIPRDPLLLVPSVAQKAQALAGQNVPPDRELIWALTLPSPFEKAGQEPVFAAVEQARQAARRILPELALQWTGASRFAAEGERLVRREISLLNSISLVAVLGVACLFVRRLWKVLHLLPVILLSTLGAWVFATLVFERLHILVFVIGSLLSGVAIDYGFYLYMQPALRPNEPYREKLARLLKPLLTSCLTTVIGFSFLLFSELPLIRQLGVFVSAGLVSALIAAILYFAQLDGAFLETRRVALPALASGRKWVRVGFVLAAAIALFGPWNLQWHDDIRDLQIAAPALQANDREVRTLFGDSDHRTVYLTRGVDAAAARDALQRFIAWHDERFPEKPAASAALLLPTEADWRKMPNRLAELRDLPRILRTVLEQRGYAAEGFEPFFQDWAAAAARPSPPSFEALADELRQHLSGPLGMLFYRSSNETWLLSLADHEPAAEPPAALHTVAVTQLETLNSLFAHYRGSALRLSAFGLSLVGASVFILYGFRRGPRIFMIPAGSCFFVFGVLGIIGQTLNLFHLLGAFLGVCLSHNYAIFSAENAGRNEPPPPSIRLSALTAAASFGVLGFSQIAVISALGSTVAFIVLTALLLVELEPLGSGAGGARSA